MGKYSDGLLATEQPQTVAAPGKYSSQLLTTPQPFAQKQDEPQQEGWGEWLVNSYRGRQDPREQSTGTVYDQFPDALSGPTATGAMMGANDAGMADIIKQNLGDKFIRQEKDAHGNPIIVTRGPDGQEQRGYVNRPGLDTQDAWRAFYGAAPYVVTGGLAGAATKGAGLGVQALAQGAAAATTSVAGDVAAGWQGSEQGIDPVKAGLMGAMGVAGPLVSAGVGSLWRNFVTIPGLVDKTTGQLTQKGLQAAKEAGIDPADITPDFAREFSNAFAKSGNPAEAATKAGLENFGIPATQGQITKRPFLLTQEEGMARGLYGQGAEKTMLGFRKEQEDAIRYAALGADNSPAILRSPTAPQTGIGEMINPTRRPGASANDRMPATLGDSIQDTLQSARRAAKTEEGQLWDKGVKNLEAMPQALNNLRPHISTALADETAFTATGEKMAKTIGEFADGNLPVTEAGGVTLAPIKSVDQMRRRLGEMVGDAEIGTDKNQAGKIYDAFNDWIGDSASKTLLSDPAAAMQLVKARAFTKNVREVFEPKSRDGKMLPAASRISKVLDDGKADSGEAVIRALLGSEGSLGANTGTVSALKSIKTALDRFAPKDEAAQAWNDIRLAYWSRLVAGKNGELVGPTAMMNNLKSALSGQSTLLNTLYTPAELQQIRLFTKALETISFKPPNASGSGYTAAAFAKEAIMKFIDSFGVGVPVRAFMKGSGIEGAVNAASARQAINNTIRPVRPNLTPAITGPGQSYLQSRERGGGR